MLSPIFLEFPVHTPPLEPPRTLRRIERHADQLVIQFAITPRKFPHIASPHFVIVHRRIPFHDDGTTFKLVSDEDAVAYHLERLDLDALHLCGHLRRVERCGTCLIDADYRHVCGGDRTQNSLVVLITLVSAPLLTL